MGVPSYAYKGTELDLPNAKFPSNPCRLVIGDQLVVLFREDIFSKMRRNAIHVPDPQDFEDHVSDDDLLQV